MFATKDESVDTRSKSSTKDKSVEQRRSSKEIQNINSADPNIYDTTGNEGTSDGYFTLIGSNDLNQDIVNDHNINKISKQEDLKHLHNNGNENINLNKNREDSNIEFELLTRGDGDLNVTNKQEYLFNTGRNNLAEKVVDTTAPPTQVSKSDSDRSTDSYSSSFESSDDTEKERSQSEKENTIKEPLLNVNTENTHTKERSDCEAVIRGNIQATKDTESELNTNHPGSKPDQVESKGQIDSSTADTYTEIFCSDSNTKTRSETVDNSGSEKTQDDDPTLTETSWPSYCQDKGDQETCIKNSSNLENKTETGLDDKTADNKIVIKDKQEKIVNEGINVQDSNVTKEKEISVKDHAEISISFSKNENKSVSPTKDDNKSGQERDDEDATLSDTSFPTYRSEDPLPLESAEIQVAQANTENNTRDKSEISSSAKTTNEVSLNHNCVVDSKDILIDNNNISQSKKVDDLKNKEESATLNDKTCNHDDTLEDIEPISNSVALISADSVSAANDSQNIAYKISEDMMAKQKYERPAAKNSDSDAETEKIDGPGVMKANQQELVVQATNGDDGVFSGESDGESKEKNNNDKSDENNSTDEDDKPIRRKSNDWVVESDDIKGENDEGNNKELDDRKSEEGNNENIEQDHKDDDPQPKADDYRSPADDNHQMYESNNEQEHIKIESVAQIKRNITIDSAVDTVSELEVKVQDLMENMKDLMKEYNKRLNSQPLSDFVLDLDKFNGDFISLRDAYKKYESLFVYLNKCLKELRTSGDEVNNLIAKRFREEDLTTWLESAESFEEEKHKLREERIAVERSALAKASEARSSVAKAAVAVAEVNQMANEAEIDAAEAEGLAKKAWEAAELALKSVEEAKKAAIEKRHAEEEARKRAQDRAQKKAEEEKKQREEEDKLLAEEAKKKGTTLQHERKRADEEKAKREAERVNPNNWPRYIFSVEPGDYDPGVGCIVRSLNGSISREDVEVTRLDQDTGILELVETEELVSNIVEIKPVDPEKKFIFEFPMSIAFPHCAPRGIPGKEPVIKTLQANGKWAELPSTEVGFDDIKELRFVETKTKKFGTFAVVLRLKRDTLTFTKKGNKVFSTVDSRVSFTCKPSVFKMNTNFNVEVQPVELSAVTELKQRNPKECNDLLAASPIIKLSILTRKFAKPLLVTMPLPPNTSRPKRPQTAVAGNRSNAEGQEARPLTARPSTALQSSNQEEDLDEEIHLLIRNNTEQIWTKLTNATLFQARNKDIVSFEINEPRDRFIVLRTKEGLSTANVERMAFMVETSIMYRTIQVFLRQKTDNPTEVVLSCAQSNRVERAFRKFGELGYEEGPNPSKDIIVKEGQVLEIGFRGNIHCTNQSETLKLLFNTHIRSQLDFNVQEIEKFAQKSFHTYRGFAQVYSNILHKKLQIAEHQTAGAPKRPPQVEVLKERMLLAELLINIPKPEPEPPKPLKTAPVKIHVEAPDTKDVLEYVATELGDEWKMLAQLLNLKSVRIQAILRQNTANPDPKKIRYDMLVSWAKRLPRSANKLELLATGLTSCGRSDIANELRDKDTEYKRSLAKAYKDTHLQRAFVKVAQNPNAVRSWMAIARRLGVSEDDLKTIDQSKPSVQEKCFQSLRKWQAVAGEQATIYMLTDKLRKCRYRQLASEIETIG